MRKTFKFICAAVVAAFAVSSCYDDALVWDELDKHSGEIAGLAERVAALETKLNSEVATLNGTISALEGKVAAADEKLNKALTDLATRLDKKDAEIAADVKNVLSQVEALKKSAEESTYDAVLKALQEKDAALEKALADLSTKLGADIEALSDELLAELAEALESVAVQKVEEKDGVVVVTLANGKTVSLATPDANANNTGLVTIVDGEWHVVLEDGTTKSLDVPVGVEEIKFEVNFETYELEFSVNGGEFVGTGAYVSDKYEYLVYGTAYEQDDYVTLTIGGVEYNLPKVNETKAILLAGLTYFENDQKISIPLKNAVSAFVVSTPKGWAAEVSTDPLALVVTAPAEDNAEAETSGKVEVWMLGEDGKVFSAVLPVAIGIDVIHIDFNKADLTIEITVDKVNDSYPVIYYGASTVNEFNPESVIKNYRDQHTNLDPAFSTGTPSVKARLDELVSSPLDANKDYVIWAYVEKWEEDPTAWPPAEVFASNVNDIIKEYVELPALKLNITPYVADAKIEVELFDPKAVGFYGFYSNQWTWPEVSMYLQMMPSMMQTLLSNGLTGMAQTCKYSFNGSTKFTGNLCDFGWDDEWKSYYEEITDGNYNYIMPNTTSYVGIIPIYDGKATYTFDDIILIEVPTLPLVNSPEETYSAIIDQQTKVIDYFNITADIITDAPYIFYEVYTDAEDIPSDDSEIISAAVEAYSFTKVNDGKVHFDIWEDMQIFLNQGTEYTIVVVACGEDGKAKVFKLKETTKSIPYAEGGLSVSGEIVSIEDDGSALLKFSIEGDADFLIYNCNIISEYDEEDKEVLKMLNAYNNSSSETWTVDGWKVLNLSTLTKNEELSTEETSVYFVVEEAVEGNNYVHSVVLSSGEDNPTLSKMHTSDVVVNE